MGYSKAFLLLGLVFAVVLLIISSDVSARELAEAAQTHENVQSDAVEEAKHGKYEHHHGGEYEHHHGGYEHHHGHGGHGGHHVKTDAVEEAEYEHVGGDRHGRGRHHPPGHGGHDAVEEAKYEHVGDGRPPKNGGRSYQRGAGETETEAETNKN